MRIQVLTQEDAFYIPRILDLLLEKRRDVVGVAIVPGELQAGRALRFLRMMGPRDFALQVLNLAWYRVLDLLSRVRPLSTSHSVAAAARRGRVPIEHVPNVNAPEFVAALRARGVDAVGVSALDGGIVRARRHTNASVLGEVGEVAAVDVSLLTTLLAAGRMPVVASLGDDGEGALLNLNADDVAAAIAGALPAADLVLLSDTPGLVLDGEVVRSLAAGALEQTLARPDVTGGMRPKLRAAGQALAGGVERVHIAAWSGPDTLKAILDGTAVATTLNASHEESHA